MDLSTVLEGDALTPLLAALDDAAVAGAGWRGSPSTTAGASFADAGPGEVEALLGYLFAVRRSAALQVPLPPKARFYRNADMEWSFLLREAGVGRLVVPAVDLPVRQDRHRGYHDSDPALPRQGVARRPTTASCSASAGARTSGWASTDRGPDGPWRTTRGASA